jgi:phospholipid/cholesterol/gamma-HCH transport system substrate-binding protein
MFLAMLWMAQVQFKTSYTSYETDVPGPVSGLSTGALVRLNGIEIGRVTSMALNPKDPQFVSLVLQVRNDAAIHADAVASLESEGLTGVDYVEISGGTAAAPVLAAKPGQGLPKILSRASSLQQVLNATPELLSHLNVVADRLASMLDTKNQEAVAETLASVRDTVGVFGRRIGNIDQIIADSSQTMHNLAGASEMLKDTLADLRQTSAKADGLIASADATVREAGRLATHLDGVVETSKPGIRDLTTEDVEQLHELLDQSRSLVASLTRVSTALERDPSRLLFGDHRSGYRPQ